MTSWNGQSKSSAPAWNGSAAIPATSWGPYTKAGQGWLYDQLYIDYSVAIDPVSGNKVYYDSIGILPIWVNQNKS